MSNFHILNSHEKDHRVRVAFHIAVPNANNSVGVNYRTALTQYKPLTESAVPWLAADFSSELTQLQNGELYEHVTDVKYDAGKTDGEKLTAITSAYTSFNSSVKTKLQKILKYWGKNAT